MKQILILGSGAGGTMVANNLRKKLNPKQWEVTIIDNDEIHHYQPGWLFIPFGVYTPEDCQKPKRNLFPGALNSFSMKSSAWIKKAALWKVKRINTAMIS